MLPCPNGLGRVEFSSFGPYSSYGPYRLLTVRKEEVTVRKLHVIMTLRILRCSALMFLEGLNSVRTVRKGFTVCKTEVTLR